MSCKAGNRLPFKVKRKARVFCGIETGSVSGFFGGGKRASKKREESRYESKTF